LKKNPISWTWLFWSIFMKNIDGKEEHKMENIENSKKHIKHKMKYWKIKTKGKVNWTSKNKNGNRKNRKRKPKETDVRTKQ
jgi:hypothetical protein